MKHFIMMFLLAMVLVSSVGADDINRHSSLYMDVWVKSVDGGNVTFINNVGDIFNFTDVTKTFKVGEEATLEFVVDFKGETFVVIDAFYVAQNTRLAYPDNSSDEWKLHIALIILALVLLFGGYLIGINNRPYNRKIKRG